MIAGRLDLSLESSFVFAPTVAIVAMTEWFVGMDPLLAIAITILVGALVGIFNGLRLQSWGQCISSHTCNSDHYAWCSAFGYQKAFNLLKFTLTWAALDCSAYALAVIVLVIAFLISYLIMKRTAFGRSLIGIGTTKRLVGLPV